MISTTPNLRVDANTGATASSDVVYFQEEGSYTTEDSLAVQFENRTTDSEGDPERLRELSVCAWVSLNYLRSRNTVFLSYATSESLDALFGGEPIESFIEKSRDW